MYRRHFLALAAGTGSLAACANYSNTVDTVASDVNTIAQGFLGVMPVISSIPGLGADALAMITSAIANLQQIAQEIKQATSTVAAQPLVQQVETDINTVVSALAAIPVLPPTVQIAMQAAAILLPIIEASVNLVTAPKLAARATTAHMTPNQARGFLRDLALH